MTLSLNEVEATGKRAARGAGLSWGLAEEAGKAARWLCARGEDGCGVLAKVLAQTDSGTPRAVAPRSLDDPWQAPPHMLCPLRTGASLSDCAARLWRHAITMQNITYPLFLLPFAAGAARQLTSIVSVSWSGFSAVCNASHLVILRDRSTRNAAHMDAVSVALTGIVDFSGRDCSRADPAPVDWMSLERIAHRTYAPATEESRLRGAGDNDPTQH